MTDLLRFSRCFVILIIISFLARAQTQDSTVSFLGPKDRPINFHLLDYPMNFKDGYYWPSYNQSIYATVAVHELVNTSLGKLFEPIHPFWGKAITMGSVLVFNVFYSYIPTGTAWEHQEAHRAVLRYRGIHSHNQANEFRFFQKRIATNEVTDQDLIDFKRDYPAEFIRLRGAGHEGQLEVIEQMKKDAFFYGTPGYRDVIPYLLNTAVTIQYLNEWRQDDYDQKIDERNKVELTPDVRDISGVEFTAYVYDLFRPDEPYDKRGIDSGAHPYGIGVDRYIGNEDLTTEEADYLRRQSLLVFLNLLSPHNFGFPRFKATNPFNHDPMFWNVSVVHNLISFGHVIDFNFFLQQHKWNLFFTYHNYRNQNNYFPGLDLEVHRFPLKKFFVTTGLGLWIQPKDQLFKSDKGTPGGLLKLGIASAFHKHLEWFVEGDVKSEGWVSGNVGLDPLVQFQLGLNLLY